MALMVIEVKAAVVGKGEEQLTCRLSSMLSTFSVSTYRDPFRFSWFVCVWAALFFQGRSVSGRSEGLCDRAAFGSWKGLSSHLIYFSQRVRIIGGGFISRRLVLIRVIGHWAHKGHKVHKGGSS